MTLPDLDELTHALEHEAQQVEIPAPPTAELLAGGRAAVRRRRRLVGVTLLALVLVAGTALVLLRPGPLRPAPARHPDSVSDLPAGVRPKVPYRDVNDIVTNDGHHRRVFYRPPLALGPDVMVAAGDGVIGIEYSRFDGTGTGALNGPSGTFLTGPPVVSADGRWAAARDDSSSSPVRVALFDLSREVRVGVASFDTRSEGFDLVGIDRTGSLYATSATESWRWDPSTGVTRALRGVDGRLVSVRGDGRVVVASGSGTATRTTIGSLDASDTFRAQSTVTGALTRWSPDDVLLAHATGDGRHVAVRTGAGERELAVPQDVTVRDLVWEDEDDLLLWVVDDLDHGSMLRCRTADGGCEVALTSFGPDASLPARP